MYNLYKFSQEQEKEREIGLKTTAFQSFLHNRQKFKVRAQATRTLRFQDFLDQQNALQQPYCIPDEYMAHTPNPEDPPLEQSAQFSPVPRPQNGQRNRLVTRQNDFSLFGTTQLSRYAAQGSNTGVEELKLTKADLGYLAHSRPLRHQQQRKVSESAMNFKERANKVLRSYEEDKKRWEKVLLLSRDRYRLCQVTHFSPGTANPKKGHQKLIKNDSSVSVEQDSNHDMNGASVPYASEAGHQRRIGRTYYKLAKESQLFAVGSRKAQLDELLTRSHYDRVKSKNSSRAHSYAFNKGRSLAMSALN